MLFIRRLILEAFIPALCLLGIAYNSLMAINGPEGTIVLREVKQKRAAQAEMLKQTIAHRIAMEKRADMLSVKTMNRDLYDETRRRVLGLSAPGELVITGQELSRYLELTSKAAH